MKSTFVIACSIVLFGSFVRARPLVVADLRQGYSSQREWGGADDPLNFSGTAFVVAANISPSKEYFFAGAYSAADTSVGHWILDVKTATGATLLKLLRNERLACTVVIGKDAFVKAGTQLYLFNIGIEEIVPRDLQAPTKIEFRIKGENDSSKIPKIECVGLT